MKKLKILEENKDILNFIADELLEKENIDGERLNEIFKIHEKPFDCPT